MPTQAQYVAQPQPASSYTYAIPSMNSPTTTGSFAIPGSEGGAGGINPNDFLQFLEGYKQRQLGLQEQQLGQQGGQFQQEFGLQKMAADLANEQGQQGLRQSKWMQQVMQGLAALPGYGSASALNFMAGRGMQPAFSGGGGGGGGGGSGGQGGGGNSQTAALNTFIANNPWFQQGLERQANPGVYGLRGNL